VDVALADDGDAVTLTVSDDGVGFDPATVANPTSFGLAGIHERASLLGATLLVRSAPGKGTTIAVRLPADRASPPSE
jgi:signal transduction histidine kinase